MKDLKKRIKKVEEKLAPLPAYDKSKAGVFTVEYPEGREEVIRIDWPYGGRIYVMEDGRLMVSEDRPAKEGEETFELPYLLAPGCLFERKIEGKIDGR